MNESDSNDMTESQTNPSPGANQPVVQTPTPDAPDQGVYDYLRATDAPLDECLDDFWTFGLPQDALPDIAAPQAEPYDILKRLGPSPFESGTFPLIGFLASTYDRVSRFADERRRA